jgi:hypothetical protein
MNASHIRVDSPQIILYMIESVMFASVQLIRFSNAKDVAIAGMGRCIRLKNKSVKHVN